MGRSSRFDKKEHKISRGLLVVVTVRIITRWLRDEKRRKKKKKAWKLYLEHCGISWDSAVMVLIHHMAWLLASTRGTTLLLRVPTPSRVPEESCGECLAPLHNRDEGDGSLIHGGVLWMSHQVKNL